MEIAVDLGGLDELARSLQYADAAPQAALGPFLRAYTDALDRIIPVRSGRMRRSVRVSATGDQALVEIDTPYALYVILGVRPQFMTWLQGKSVSFVARDGARVIRRAARVGVWGGRRHFWHPGTAPNDLFRKALDDPKVAALLKAMAEAGQPLSVAYTYPVRG